MKHKATNRSDRALRVLAACEPVVVVTHDTPDPDAIAAEWATHTPVQKRLRKSGRHIGSLAVLRAECAYRVEALQPPIGLPNRYNPSPDCTPVLIDCAPKGPITCWAAQSKGKRRPIVV